MKEKRWSIIYISSRNLLWQRRVTSAKILAAKCKRVTIRTAARAPEMKSLHYLSKTQHSDRAVILQSVGGSNLGPYHRRVTMKIGSRTSDLHGPMRLAKWLGEVAPAFAIWLKATMDGRSALLATALNRHPQKTKRTGDAAWTYLPSGDAVRDVIACTQSALRSFDPQRAIRPSLSLVSSHQC